MVVANDMLVATVGAPVVPATVVPSTVVIFAALLAVYYELVCLLRLPAVGHSEAVVGWVGGRAVNAEMAEPCVCSVL